MTELGGLLKQQNNPACTKSVRAFRVLKLDTIGKKKRTLIYHDSVQKARFENLH